MGQSLLKHPPFDAKSIIDSFKADELKGKRIVDVLPSIIIEQTEDFCILQRWKGFFKRKGSPYIITESQTPGGKRRFTLWKEDLTEEGKARYV